MKRIAVLTGKRGGYGAMKPMLRAIETHPDLELQLMVTDQHLDPNFGRTITEVEADFEVASAVAMPGQDGSSHGRVTALGDCLKGMAEELARLDPDVLVLYGDRGEVLTTAVGATHFGIPMAHVQGGDISGNIDENMRHALTKLSHLHFPSCEASAERIRGLGEQHWRIHVVGDNHVDPIVAGDYASPGQLREKLGLDLASPPIVVLQHPETTRRRDHRADMAGTLEAVLATARETGSEVVCVYPCSDQGHEGVIEAIESARGAENLHVFKNLIAPDFWGLLACARVMVGNSSAGLIETPYFPVAAINLGERQKDRQHADNLLHTEFGVANVRTALSRVASEDWQARVRDCARPFGDGHAGERIVSVLAETDLADPALIDKRMTY